MDDNFDTENTSSNGGSKSLMHPYKMNREEVYIRHFKNARIYDATAPEEFEVQYPVAKRAYRQWLANVRSIPGWENFRRRGTGHGARENDGLIISSQKTLGNIGSSDNTKLSRLNLLSRGNIDSPEKQTQKSVPTTNKRGIEAPIHRLFTEAMGREISEQRSKLEMSQVELARKINVHPSVIRSIELGGLLTFRPDDPMVRALAQVLQLPSIEYKE